MGTKTIMILRFSAIKSVNYHYYVTIYFRFLPRFEYGMIEIHHSLMLVIMLVINFNVLFFVIIL